MPAPTHTRITFSGIFTNGTAAQEEWQFNVHAAPLSATTAANCATVATAAKGAWFTNLAPMFTSDISLTRTRVAVVDSTGHVAKDFDGSYKQGDNTTASSSIGTATAATGTGFLPLQTALCVSLDSARAGATGKGRFFLPFPRAYAIGSDYRLTVSNTGTIAAAARAFVNGIATACGSAVVVPSPKAGVLSNVVAVRVGQVPDTMRSRRGRLLESYQRVLL